MPEATPIQSDYEVADRRSEAMVDGHSASRMSEPTPSRFYSLVREMWSMTIAKSPAKVVGLFLFAPLRSVVADRLPTSTPALTALTFLFPRLRDVVAGTVLLAVAGFLFARLRDVVADFVKIVDPGTVEWTVSIRSFARCGR